jgi:hypothetical protein
VWLGQSLRSFPRHTPPTFLQALETLRFPLSGLQKRHIQPERYVQFALKFGEKLLTK